MIEQHGPHKGYTDIVRNLLETWAEKNPEYTPKQTKVFLEKLAGDLKKNIQNNKNDFIKK